MGLKSSVINLSLMFYRRKMKNLFDVKKTLFVLCVITLMTINISAQNVVQTGRGLRLSVNMGMLYSNMTGNGTQMSADVVAYRESTTGAYTGYTNIKAGQRFLIGYKIGMGLGIDFNRTLSLNIDLNFEQKGFKVPIHAISYPPDNQSNYVILDKNSCFSNFLMRYIILPIALEIRINRFYVAPGIYTGVFLEAIENGEISAGGNTIILNHHRSQYALMDMGFLIHAGINVPLAERHALKVALGGAWGFSGANQGFSMPSNVQFNNQSFSLDVKYSFKIKLRIFLNSLLLPICSFSTCNIAQQHKTRGCLSQDNLLFIT
jgi:hypothetical protein